MAEKVFSKQEPLKPTHSFVWKQTELTQIEFDVYLPARDPTVRDTLPVVLYIHGGGFIGGNRTGYCRPLFEDLLQSGAVIVSTDYRLLPETGFVDGQLEDIRDVGSWVREQLPAKLRSKGFEMACGNIVVIGSSAGAFLALLTPKLWKVPPTAILSIYGATNLHDLPYLAKGPLHNIEIPTPDSDFLRAVTNFDSPPTNTPNPRNPREWLTERTKLGFYVMRAELTAALMIKGLVKGTDGHLSLPDKAGLAKEDIDAISPLQLCRKIKYPPVYQIMGSVDSCYDSSHVSNFAATLEEEGVPHVEHIVEGKDHAFDMRAESGDSVHQEVISPAAKWIVAQAYSRR